MVAIAAMLACYYGATRTIRRRWIRNTFIPQADKGGVDLKTLAAVMVNVAKMGERIDDKMRDMASEAWLLEQEAANANGES